MVAAALGAAGCGGGGGAPTPPPGVGGGDVMTPAQPATAADTALKAARTAVDAVTDDATGSTVKEAETRLAAARTAVDKVPAAERAALSQRLGNLEGTLAAAKRSRTAAMEMKAEMDRKAGPAFFAALEGPNDDGSQTALDNITGTRENDRFSTADADGVLDFALWLSGGGGSVAGHSGGTPSVDNVEARFKFGDGKEAGMLGAWKGTDLEKDVTDPKGKDRVRVYTDRGQPTTPLAATWFAVSENRGKVNAGGHADGERKLDLAGSGTDNVHVASAEFPAAGRKLFKPESGSGDNQIRLRGTLAGAPGHYICTVNDAQDNCGIAKGAKGWKLDDKWEFVYDEGARMAIPDANYLYFGWWMRLDADGMPTAASAFHGSEGPGGSGTIDDEVKVTTAMAGTATYVGKAAGIYGIKDPINERSDGGGFTADAELTALFGTAGSVTGTIDNFRLKGGSENPGWSVALGKRVHVHDYSHSNDANPNTRTTWSIGGEKADPSGGWKSRYFDDRRDDGLDIPNSMTGTFYSEFGKTHRMVGAFGAKLQAE